MLENPGFIVRRAGPDDVSKAMRLSVAEGWNQTENDWRLLIDSPQNICMLVERGENIIGTTAAMNYSNKIIWIGMVLVDKMFRGQGVSRLLLMNILEQVAPVSVKLDATSEGQPVYKKFNFTDEYAILRMVHPAVNDFAEEENVDILHGPKCLKYGSGIIACDEAIFGAGRTALIEFLLHQYPEKVFLLTHNFLIQGFALGRAGNKYHQIGPVYASNTGDAKGLIAKALKKLINQPVVVDVPADKNHLIEWLVSIGFTMQRRFVRMYRNENVPGIIARQYLVCGPEFG